MKERTLATNTLRLWWRFRLSLLMTWWRYVPISRWNYLATWEWTGQQCWAGCYFDEDRTCRSDPMEALREYWSYA